MSGIFAPRPRPVANTQAAVQAQSPIPPSDRSDAETAALAAEQRARFTRRRGRAATILSGGSATGGMSASRMLGAVART